MKEFGTFGMEPTFYPYIEKYPDYWNEKQAEVWMMISRTLVSNLRQKRLNHEWWKNAECDDGVLEVPTTPYSNFSKFKTDWISLKNLLKKKYSFLSSSVICLYSEGGCHITFDLSKIPSKESTFKIAKETTGHFSTTGDSANYSELARLRWGMISKREFDRKYPIKKLKSEKNLSLKSLFCQNLASFLAAHPPLVWSCLSPYDNVSSTIPCSVFNGKKTLDGAEFRKTMLLTFRDRNGVSNLDLFNPPMRVELRFFMMPRSTQEMEFHFNVANHLMHHILDISKKGRILPIPRVTHENLRNYTFDTAVAELKRLFSTLKISYKEYRDLGKEELLKERFEMGGNYLV